MPLCRYPKNSFGNRGTKRTVPFVPLLELKFDCDFLAGVGYGFGFGLLAVPDKDYAELAVLYHSVI